jgi:hypothetical protein
MRGHAPARRRSSESSACIAVKSALPTPAMTTDIGRREARTQASMVSSMSMIVPSVMIKKTTYLDRPPFGVAATPASAMSHAALSTGAKQVGPDRRTTESALR